MTASTKSFRNTMPRLFELKACADSRDPNAYFQNFEQRLETSPSARTIFTKLEGQLGALDDRAWTDLKTRAADKLGAKDQCRGWRSLFDTLNEAKGFVYLKSIGCTDVHFIPRANEKTPDLQGIQNGSMVLGEVKTINISKEEAQRRQRIYQCEIVSANISATLTDGCLQKILSTLHDALEQLQAHDTLRQCRRIIFVVIHFDDWIGDYQPEYFAQIDSHLLKNPVSGAELVVCPASNLFQRKFTMQSATVVDL